MGPWHPQPVINRRWIRDSVLQDRPVRSDDKAGPEVCFANCEAPVRGRSKRWSKLLVGLLAFACVLTDPTAGLLARVAADEPEILDTPRRRFEFGSSNRRDNGEMFKLVRPLVAEVGNSVVQIVSDGTPVCLGTVVSADGYVLTKRSELSADPIRVRLPDARLLPARVAAIRRESDLALLQVESDQLQLRPVEFADDDNLAIGSFLVSVGRGGNPIGLGAVSAKARTISHQGRLGMFLRDEQGQATVERVWPLGGAAEAGVKQGDRILAIDGRSEPNRSRVIESLRERFPGEIVRLTINREGATLDLVARVQDFGLMQESENDVKVNGPRSVRLSGFERAMQHDTVLNPDECGGPLVDTSGRVVGMNIARAGRVVSYALPASLVRSAVESMLLEARDLSAAENE
ncbi:MAG: PDZ domain-containing protein [Planctomycetaceae bacterium]|nr:MAG: PDZ domain-containing protein [Planctomycetaceae bacterium]